MTFVTSTINTAGLSATHRLESPEGQITNRCILPASELLSSRVYSPEGDQEQPKRDEDPVVGARRRIRTVQEALRGRS